MVTLYRPVVVPEPPIAFLTAEAIGSKAVPRAGSLDNGSFVYFESDASSANEAGLRLMFPGFCNAIISFSISSLDMYITLSIVYNAVLV